MALAANVEIVEKGMELVSHPVVASDIIYKGKIIKGQRIDLLVEDEVVVEIKSLSKLPEVASAQTLSYLKATKLRRGLIVNFGEKRLIDGVKRVAL